MSNKYLSEAELKQAWDMLLMVARTAQWIELETVQKMIETIQLSHAMGPIIDPTKYRDVGIDNLTEQQMLAQGFLAFRKSIEDAKKYAIDNGLMADKG